MRSLLLLLVGVAAVVAGCASAADRAPLSAEATLKDKDGKQVGVATLIETPEGVRIAVTGYRLPPGGHGLHIHAVGRCDPPEFTTAGAHFNPGNKQHGKQNPAGPHAGDLPNLMVAASGEGGIDVTTRAFTLSPGPTSLLGDKGTALVVHANPDDDKTDPTGNSGARIACGVIAK
ncbi:MAG TPA: superoxide dismutase family protein [Methylomirabilota bacterium]|nr:superoxide dismutase family protein [Methylomirabilota bacterium]